jgi:hypothetical protein
MQIPIHAQHLHSPFGPNIGMDMGMHPGMVHPSMMQSGPGMIHPGMMHPGMNMGIPTMSQPDPFGFMNVNSGVPMMPSYSYPDLASLDLLRSFGGRACRRRNPYHDLYSYGSGGSGLGRSSSRYMDPYDLFDEVCDDSDLYLDDYDDIDDPLMLYMRMARSGGGGGRRGGGRRGGRCGLGRFFD